MISVKPQDPNYHGILRQPLKLAYKEKQVLLSEKANAFFKILRIVYIESH